MTKLITIPKFAAATGLPYRLCLHLIGTGQIPSVAVGRRRRIDVRWVEQWLSTGGYRSSGQESPTQHGQVAPILNAGEPRSAAR